MCFVTSPSGTLHVERTKELYRDLLSVFDKLILPTHASCHVQYTLFYLCSFRLVSTSHAAHVLGVKPIQSALDLLVWAQVTWLGGIILWLYRWLSFQALAEAFLEHLWKILQSPSQPAVLRQAAAGYLGSFLARAKFIPVLWVHSAEGSTKAPHNKSARAHLYILTCCSAIFWKSCEHHISSIKNLQSGLYSFPCVCYLLDFCIPSSIA